MMKKMRLFRRITATAMVFAMVGITSAFAASSESYGSMTNGKGEIGHIILNDVLPEEEKLSTKSSASPDTEMVISDSPTNGNGEIKHIIVIDSEVMPLATYKDYELPANTAVFFAGESVTSAKMSVEYMPTNLDLYYGLGTKPDGSGTHYANRATGGSGSTTIRPSIAMFDGGAVSGLLDLTELPEGQYGVVMYGTVRTAKLVGYKPDLIAAVGNGGVEGYVRMDDMRPNITSEADIEAYYEKLENDPDIPLYDMNGNVIGTFTIGGNEDLAPEATTVEEARAAIMADMSSPVVPNEDVNQTKDRLLNENDNLNTIYHEAPVNSVDVWAATSNQYTEKNGLTYGTMKQAGVIGEPPDMVSVVATNGMQGWVTLEDFSPVRYLRKIGTSEAEINSYIDKTMNENVQKFIPVYDMEGNVIGEFPTGYSM